jgi:hypothetical protein
VSFVSVPVESLVHTFYSVDLKPYLMLKILVAGSYEVIAGASTDVHVQLKSLLVKVQVVVHPNAKDYCDSNLPDDSSLVIVDDVKMLHQPMDAQEVTFD